MLLVQKGTLILMVVVGELLRRLLLQIINMYIKTYYNAENFCLIEGDSLKILRNIKSNSIDMIFADPPYFLSGDGITCISGKMKSVKKGKWDEKVNIDSKHKFNRKWIKLCKEILKDNGTIWVSGTMHNIYSIGMALEQEGFRIINNITWKKLNPPPNISCRAFTHSTETILWAKKDKKNAKHKFNYNVMKNINDGKQMKDVWETSLVKPSEKKYGKHPTQKPIEVLKKIILASTDENDLILDPFNGSGTTGIACALLNRKYIGIDNVSDYLETTKKRYLQIKKPS
jgi:site-specific DNA-methyltransferase (adenine-specific)